MVTLPPPSGSTPHRRREIAESFGDDADRYDRARPRYPEALAATVLEGLPGRSVLDVGIGTGISALPFRDAGALVLGVEVDARMAELARSRGFEVEVSGFEEWDASGRKFEAVIAGQSWHWIDPAAGAAKAAGLLRPAGRLALFWNVGEPEPEIARAFADVYRRVETGLPFTPWDAPAIEGYATITTRAIDGIVATGAFTTPARLRFDRQAATIARDAWLDQVPTMGGHSRIPADKLTSLLDGLAQVLDEHGGSFTMSSATIATTADRLTA